MAADRSATVSGAALWRAAVRRGAADLATWKRARRGVAARSVAARGSAAGGRGAEGRAAGSVAARGGAACAEVVRRVGAGSHSGRGAGHLGSVSDHRSAPGCCRALGRRRWTAGCRRLALDRPRSAHGRLPPVPNCWPARDRRRPGTGRLDWARGRRPSETGCCSARSRHPSASNVERPGCLRPKPRPVRTEPASAGSPAVAAKAGEAAARKTPAARPGCGGRAALRAGPRTKGPWRQRSGVQEPQRPERTKTRRTRQKAWRTQRRERKAQRALKKRTEPARHRTTAGACRRRWGRRCRR